MLTLLEKKEFEFITVKELCERAGVNRSTFYLHYENTADLLAETIELINRRFHDAFRKNLASVAKERFFVKREYLIPYLEFVKQNQRIFALIHNKPHLFHCQKTLERMYVELFSPILDTYGVPKAEQPYVFAFFTRGTLAIVMEWLEGGCKDEIVFVAEMMIRLIGYEKEN